MALSVISETLMQSICLFNCFVSCSSLRKSSTSTTRVILEMPIVSVRPTEMLSMLNCLFCNRPVMRFNTPLRFWTVAVIIRFIFSPQSFRLTRILVEPLDKHFLVGELGSLVKTVHHRQILQGVHE